MSTSHVLLIAGGAIALVVVTVVPVVLIIWLLRRLLGGSKEQRARADRLVATGSKARARIVAVVPTGMIVNEINIRCVVSFEITPLAGGASFAGDKKILINQAAMPRTGDEWPCWFDAADPSQFAIGQPGVDARETIGVFREFGIPHPLER